MLILADSAQVADQKLYLLGGGWRFIQAQGLPVTHQMGVAVGILVDWLETNQKHKLSLEVLHDDSKVAIAKLQGEFEQGRPPGFPAGSEQRVLLAFNAPLKFEKDGPYVARVEIDGEELARTVFMVRDKSRKGTEVA
jgi:hypothetical protein